MGTRVDNLEDEIFDLKEQLSFVISEMNRLEEQNKSLQAELDKQIKDNRKLVKALKVYANTKPYLLREDVFGNKQLLDIRKIAQDILKEIGEEE